MPWCPFSRCAVLPIPDTLVTQHEHSQKIGHAFAKGCGGRVLQVQAHDPTQDVAFYGILRGTGDIAKRRLEKGDGFWYVDHGYIRPGHYSGHYRIVRSGLHTNLRQTPDYGRLLALKWTPDKDHVALDYSPVLLAPPSEYVAEFFGCSREGWIETVRDKLRKITDRPLIVSSKEDPGQPTLDQAWCVVTLQSNLSVEAIRKGVPVFVEHANFPDQWMHPAEFFSDKLENLNTPYRPSVSERYEWGAKLAATQFTLVEINSGYAWEYINRA